MMEQIIENRRLALLTRNFQAPSYRLNRVQESDAELVDLGYGSAYYLAATMDSLEGVESGLYGDPNSIGWMLATANFSDLAAVGADPLGLLVTVNSGPAQEGSYLSRVASGIDEACRGLGTYVLGAETGRSEHLCLTGCALGLVPKDEVITRVGARPADRVYMSGPPGLGAAHALLHLAGGMSGPAGSFFKPTARLMEGKLVRRFASSAMDTGDGLIHTLDTLMRINRCQFIIEDRWPEIIHPLAERICRARGIPLWLALAAVPGEFELCFTIRPDREQAFLAAARKAGWFPVAVGRAAEGTGVIIHSDGKAVALDTASILNIATEAGADRDAYIQKLREIGKEAGI